MKTDAALFYIMDGIRDSDYATETLASIDEIERYAESVGTTISKYQALPIQEIGQAWIAEIQDGNGEWSRMREDARAALADAQARSSVYRAAYIPADPDSTGGGIVLTGREHSGLTDEDLLAEAMAEIERNDLGFDRDRVLIGDWRE